MSIGKIHASIMPKTGEWEEMAGLYIKDCRWRCKHYLSVPYSPPDYQGDEIEWRRAWDDVSDGRRQRIFQCIKGVFRRVPPRFWAARWLNGGKSRLFIGGRDLARDTSLTVFNPDTLEEVWRSDLEWVVPESMPRFEEVWRLEEGMSVRFDYAPRLLGQSGCLPAPVAFIYYHLSELGILPRWIMTGRAA